jgi:2-keto-3-deoxy-L-arabinonate dehydratase
MLDLPICRPTIALRKTIVTISATSVISQFPGVCVVADTYSLNGVIPIIPTPFTADLAIDYDALSSCVRFAAGVGLCACCLPAYASEFYKLTEAERTRAIETAVAASAGKIKILAQSNHPSRTVAVGLACENEKRGADMISFAIPRIFALTAGEVLDYCRAVCEATALPVLIQDFNPGGPTVGADFAVALHDRCPNFKYLKLEEPLMGPKVRDIRQATGQTIGVLEGWGGLYLLDLLDEDICGLMPGLGPSDLLQKVWSVGKGGDKRAAFDIFAHILPQLSYSLQNMEFWLTVEKRLLADRGIIPSASTHVRPPTYRAAQSMIDHGDFLNARLIDLLKKLKMPLRPGS